jgi:two-component system chemotaxis response regulator CheB
MTPASRPLSRQSTTRGKIRVLIVDDSLVIRHLLRQALQEDPAIEVVGCEANGVAALARIPDVKPDVVTLDIEMPEMDGIETLRRIRKLHPRLRTIMFSTLTTRGAASTFEALSLGADDYVAKAANGGSLDKSLGTLRSELIPKIKQFFVLAEPPKQAALSHATGVSRPATHRISRLRVVAIGVSTGGPSALAELIPRLPARFPLPVLVVQHMPPMFTRLLAERLQADSPLRVTEAAGGVEIRPGMVLIAPGDHHLRVRRANGTVVTSLDQEPHENSCRPAVDVLFRSLAEVYHGDVLSVILTGMGHDGLRGIGLLKAAGAVTLAQDEASSVVWGMPGSVVEAGLADRVLPLDRIAPEIVRLAEGGAL